MIATTSSHTRGKLLNVREASHKQIMENKEINELVKILGLQYKRKYLTTDDLKSLRYGRVMIMTDQVGGAEIFFFFTGLPTCPGLKTDPGKIWQFFFFFT